MYNFIRLCLVGILMILRGNSDEEIESEYDLDDYRKPIGNNKTIDSSSAVEENVDNTEIEIIDSSIIEIKNITEEDGNNEARTSNETD